MKKCFLSGLLLPLMLFGGCQLKQPSVPENAQLSQIQFDRGHGSMWGIQFYIDVCPTQINRAQYILPGTSEQLDLEPTPITDEQWAQLRDAVDALVPQLEPAKNTGSSHKLDGTEYRSLTLVWTADGKDTAVQYNWPQTDQASQLEHLLESLIPGMT